MPDLDDQIRSLVASAVADAPPAPPLPSPTAAPRNRTWVKWSAAGAALLAGIVGGTAVLQPADDRDVITEDHTNTTSVVAQPNMSVLITAGPGGITRHERALEDGSGFDDVETGARITNESMAFALALDDGSYVAQRKRPYEEGAGNAHPIFIARDGEVTGEMFAAANLAGPVHLHDFAVVDGRRLLLYSIRVSTDPETASEPLFAADLDRSRTIELGNVGGWESGTSRLHLGTNGLIVGTLYSEAYHSLLVRAIPGSPADKKPLPKPSDFGLEESYFDCRCADGFVVDATGENLYWLEPAGDDERGGVIRASAIDQPSPITIGTIPNLERDDVAGIDIDISGNGIVFSSGTEVGGSQPFVRAATGHVRPLEGAYATVGPGVHEASTPTQGPSSPTTRALRATTTTTSYTDQWRSHPGVANLTFSGARSGHLTGAVASCNERPGASSELKVNGTLDGTPWVLLVQSYTGEMGGAHSVVSGPAGGGTGMTGSGYLVSETYPKTLAGVTDLEWAHGATLDVELTSPEEGNPGTLQVRGTITCP